MHNTTESLFLLFKPSSWQFKNHFHFHSFFIPTYNTLESKKMYRAYKSVHPYYEKSKSIPQDKLDAGNKIAKMLEEADMNKDGRLTRDEIEKALKSLGSYFPAWRAQRCLKKLDANNDGQISGNEIDYLVDYLLSHGFGKK